MKVLSPEICRTFELCVCVFVCLSVHVWGECGRGRLILNLPSVVGGLRSHLDSVSLCLLFSLLRLSMPPHLCCHFFTLSISAFLPYITQPKSKCGCLWVHLDPTCCLSWWTRLSFSLFRAATSSCVFFFLEEDSSSRAMLASFSLIAASSASCLWWKGKSHILWVTLGISIMK